ncbi:Metal resistance protein YCF1 [Talaromyces pinophilus]|nr:Metal resistance protein YCF1 [Talaromyces pinophilus]
MENNTLCGENEFGPTVTHCRGGFDFTLLFEESLLAIASSVLLLLALPLRYRHLWKKRTKEVARSPAYWIKAILALTYGLSQLSLMIIWALPRTPRTRTSLAAAVVAFIAYAGLHLLSHLEHIYSIQPSLLLNLFLSLSLLFDIVRVRTLWLANYTAIARLYSVSIGLKLMWFYFESRTKQAHFLNRTIQYGAEEIHGLYSRSFFWWINQLFVLGFKKNLSVESLPQLDRALSSEVVHHEVKKPWDSSSKSSSNTLAWCIFRAFKTSVLYSVTARMILIGLNYTQPFLISRLIDYVGDKSRNQNDGYGLIGAFALVFILKGVFNGIYEHHTFRFITQIRGAVVSMIYEKTLEVQSDSDDDLSAVTLMSTEVDNISVGIQNAHETWASPIELAIAIYLLEREVIWAAAIPAAISLTVFYLTGLISKSFPARQATWMQAVRERVAFTSNWLDMSKAVKMLGISEPVSRIAQQLRVRELNLQKKFRRSFVTMNLVAGIPSNLGPAITLAVYTGVAFWTGRDPLTESQTFATLSIIVLASNPLSNLVYSAPRVAGVIESFQRIQKFLLQTSRQDYRGSIRSHINLQEVPEIMVGDSISPSFEMEYITTREGMQSEAKPTNDTADVVVVQQADFSSNRATSVLLNISLRLPRGSLTLVVGPVGSGKSMLLKAILGELQCTQGFEQMQTSLKVGYCDAHSWVRNKTVQENILGPLEYDDEWYKMIVRACALKDDIESLPQGHHTLIGSNGASVSGGQRQRIAIARALYARTQLALFDDVLSALDARTSEHILKHVFGNHGLLRKHGVTVVLVTHVAHNITWADQVVALENGKIVECKRPQRLRENNELILMDTIPSGVAQDTNSSSPLNSQQPAVPPSYAVEDIADRNLGDLTNYLYYLKTAGTGNILLYFMCLIIGAFCSQFPNLWVQWWAQTNTRSHFEQLATYISVYAMLAILGSALWAWCMWLVFCCIVPKTSGRLHEYLVTKINDAPLSFLTSTNNGTTLNRFSQDMTLVDRSLPADFLKTSNNLLQCLMSAIFISVGAKYLAPLIPVAGFAVYLIQKFYLRTSRQLRLLDLETKSPLYTQFTETISGLTTVRAFGWQRYFQDEHQKLLLV